MKQTNVYLDNAGNTPLDPEVAKAMAPYLKAGFCGNSHSPNVCGAVADQAVDSARNKIAKAMKVKPTEVYFTSGATESNNWVIKGLALRELEKPENLRKTHIICSKIEHASVLNACHELEKLGFSVTYIDPTIGGRVPVQRVSAALKDKETLLVCCMAVNNETGVANDVDAMARAAHKKGALMLADFTQGLLYGDGSIRIGVSFPHVDYVSFSGHKIYGPTGVGCLIRRSDAPLSPLLSGGSQESGLRGGTHNTAGIVGLGEAVDILSHGNWEPYFNKLYNYVVDNFARELPHARLNAKPDHKNIVNICLADETSLTDLAGALSGYGVCCSAGAACSTHDDGDEPSHVLTAMGVPPARAAASIRLSFSKYTLKKDINSLLRAMKYLCHNFPKEA